MNSIKQGSNHTINLVSKLSGHTQSSTHKNKLQTAQLSVLPSNQKSRKGNYNLHALVSLIKRLISQVGKENQKDSTPQSDTNNSSKRTEEQTKTFWENSQAFKRNDDGFYSGNNKKEDNNQK